MPKDRDSLLTDISVTIVSVLDGEVEQVGVREGFDFTRVDVDAPNSVADDGREPDVLSASVRAHDGGAEQTQPDIVLFDFARGSVQASDLLAKELSEPHGFVVRDDDTNWAAQWRRNLPAGDLFGLVVEQRNQVGSGLAEIHL